MDDNEITRAIDEVAQSMTDGDLDAGFRARVMARIEEPGFGIRGSGFAVRWPAFAGLAAAVVVVAVFVMRDREVAQPFRAASETRAPAIPDTLIVDPRPNGAGDHAAAPVASVRPTAGGTRGRAPDYGASPVAALAPPRLDVKPLGMPAIDAVDSIQLQEIAVRPIGVAALPTVDPLPQGEMIR